MGTSRVPPEPFLDLPRTSVRPDRIGPWERTRSFVSRTLIFGPAAARAGLVASEFPPINAVQMGLASSWGEPIPAPAVKPGREQVLDAVMDVVSTLLRHLLVNQPGVLFLTEVGRAVDRLPRPDLVWRGVFRFLGCYPQVAEQVQMATVLELPDNIWELGEIEDLGRPQYRVQLPGDLWQMLGIDPAQIGEDATKLGARLLGAGLMMPARLAGPGPQS